MHLAQRVDHRPVERIHPQHRPIGFVDVAMPVAAGGQHQVARPHFHRFAIDDGHGGGALDDEADRARGMAVRRRDLAGQHHLHVRGERMRRGAQIDQRRIDQLDDTPLGIGTGRDQAAGAVHEGPNVGPRPVTRRIGRRDATVGPRGRPPAPQRVHILAARGRDKTRPSAVLRSFSSFPAALTPYSACY